MMQLMLWDLLILGQDFNCCNFLRRFLENLLFYAFCIYLRCFIWIWGSMKAVFPKNIQKGLLAGLTLTVGPISVSIIQIFILAVGVAGGFLAFNQFQKVSRAMGAIVAVFVVLIFVVIAFFKISEMNLLEFIVKFIKSHFIDTAEKYQTNYNRPNPLEISFAKNKAQEGKVKIEYKTGISLEKVDQLESSGLI